MDTERKYHLYEDLVVDDSGRLCRLAKVGTQLRINGCIGFIERLTPNGIADYYHKTGNIVFKGTALLQVLKTREGLPLFLDKNLA